MEWTQAQVGPSLNPTSGQPCLPPPQLRFKMVLGVHSWRHNAGRIGLSFLGVLVRGDLSQPWEGGTTTITQAEMIRGGRPSGGAGRYLASFPPAGHAGPWPPCAAQLSSRCSDQSQSRRGIPETVQGRSLGKINTEQGSSPAP